jgi:hypothetical protein
VIRLINRALAQIENSTFVYPDTQMNDITHAKRR